MIRDNDPKASSAQGEVLLAHDLRKFYGPREALKGLSFSLQAGRILGFLGPNGAGKTTAIRILTTILEPDAGYFIVDGIRSEYPEDIRRKIGVLPESLGFHKQMTGIECLTFFGRLYGRSATQARTNGMVLLEDVGLEQRSRSLVGTYSRGMRQRLGIARALVNDPAVVFLDEPTLGLDPRGQQELLELIRRITRERHVGVVLCSHALSEVEVICDDVVIMHVGQVVASGTVADVIGRTQRDVMQRNDLRIQVAPSSVAAARQVLEAMPHVRSVTPTGADGAWLRVELVDSGGTSAEQQQVHNQTLEGLIHAHIPVLSFAAEGSRLQEAFLHLTEGEIA